MSVLLTVPLGPWPPAPSGSDDKTPYALRGLASNVLRLISEQYASKYPGLLPRTSIYSHDTTTGRPMLTPRHHIYSDRIIVFHPYPCANAHGLHTPRGSI